MDREKVIKALQYCKDNQHVNDCEECDYGGISGMFCYGLIDEAIAMLKEQEEREKRTCKEICGLIKGGYRADTDDDREYICHRIRYIFLNSLENKQKKFTQKEGKELAEWIYLFLIEEGQHNMKFKLGEIITNTPDEVRNIIKKYINELYKRNGKWYRKN